MDRRNSIKTVGEDVKAHLATPPPPKREQYPSDRKTPAVATRLPRTYHEQLKAIIQATGLSTATVCRAILQDWLDQHEADGEREIKRLVTRSINGL